jgi:Flp pilus assembly protein TadD
MSTYTAEAKAQEFVDGLKAVPTTGKMPPEQQELIYAMAYNLVTLGQYAEAIRYLGLLTLVAPTDTRFLGALALAYQLSHLYDEAIAVYSLVTFLTPEDVKHTLAVAECQLLKGDSGEAKATLVSVLNYCKLEGNSSRVAQRAKALLGFLSPEAAAAYE